MTKTKSDANRSRHTVILNPDSAQSGRSREKHPVHESKPINPANIKHDRRPFKGVRKEALKGLHEPRA